MCRDGVISRRRGIWKSYSFAELEKFAVIISENVLRNNIDLFFPIGFI